MISQPHLRSTYLWERLLSVCSLKACPPQEGPLNEAADADLSASGGALAGMGIRERWNKLAIRRRSWPWVESNGLGSTLIEPLVPLERTSCSSCLSASGGLILSNLSLRFSAARASPPRRASGRECLFLSAGVYGLSRNSSMRPSRVL